jgi:thymidylate synthase (FAD)
MAATGIEIFCIARTQVDRKAVRRWLDHLEVSQEFELPSGEAVSDPALLIAIAAKRCYRSFEAGQNPNITSVRKDYGEYLENILKQGHGSVLEHSVYTFAFEGVSRVFSAEMNRHRAGWAISEGSLRFIRFGEGIPYWEPTSIQGENVLDPEEAEVALRWIEAGDPVEKALSGIGMEEDAKRQLTRLAFQKAFRRQEESYRVLERIWAAELAPDSKFKAKKEITSMMRRIVGLGVATGGVWTGNIRALRHVLTMRCSPAAEEEILHVFNRVLGMMIEMEPLLIGDFHQDEQGYWRPKYMKV